MPTLRLCLYCNEPIQPKRGKPSPFCQPSHKQAWKMEQRAQRPRARTVRKKEPGIPTAPEGHVQGPVSRRHIPPTQQ